MKEQDVQPSGATEFDQRREANLRAGGLLPNPEWAQFADRAFRMPNQFGQDAAKGGETRDPMKEYLHDEVGFFRADHFSQTGEKARPVEEVHGELVFDSKVEQAQRAEHRQRVEQWNRRLGSRVSQNPYPRKMK